MSKSLRLPREKHLEPQQMSRDPGVLAVLTSEQLSRAGVVQILATSTSKSAPRLSVFNDFDFQIVLARRCSEVSVLNPFDFQIVLARRRGATFGDLNFQKAPRGCQF